MARIVSKGTHSGRTPYGFNPIKTIEDGKAVVERWEIDEAKAEVIREMARLAVEENMGFLAIANALNDKGYRTSAGGHWVGASVHVILRNPVLNGTMAYGRRGKKKANVAEEQALIRVEGVFPEILSNEEWAALQQRLDIRREHSRGATHKSEYLLSGILRCGHCGGPMIGKMTSTYKGKGYPRYYCSNAQKSRESCAYYNGHAAPKLEAAILEHLGQYSNPKKVKELLDADGRRDIKKREAELKRVEKQLGVIEADFAKNLDLLKRELLNEDEFKRANEARREEQAQLQARREELVSSLAAQSERHDAVTALPAQIQSFLKDFQSLDVRRAKALLQTILAAATVSRDGTIELSFR
jgi:site-specific DNA recombinase